MQTKVPVGLSTATGGTVTLAAYIGAIVAFLNGARDAETVTLLALGTVALVSTMAGRFAQAVAQVHAHAVITASTPVVPDAAWAQPPAPPAPAKPARSRTRQKG